MARRWLGTIITNEQSKIEKLKLLNDLDSLDPADDLLHDQATADAWEKIKSDGLNCASSEHPLVAHHLDLIRDDLNSKSRHNIIQRDFKQLTGHPQLSAIDHVKVLSLLITGKAAAWSRHGNAFADIDKAANDFLDSAWGTLGPEPKLQPQESNPSSMSVYEAETDELDLDPNMLAIVSRISVIERAKMLRNGSDVCFGEAAARLRKVRSMSAEGRPCSGWQDVQSPSQP